MNIKSVNLLQNSNKYSWASFKKYKSRPGELCTAKFFSAPDAQGGIVGGADEIFQGRILQNNSLIVLVVVSAT